MNPSAERHPPGPRGGLLLGCAPALLTDPLAFVQQLARDYPELASFRLGPQRVYFATGTEALEQLLSSEVKRFFSRDRAALRAGKSFLGGGLLFLDGEPWARARRMSAPAFHRDHLARHALEMQARTAALLARWEDGEVRNIHLDMMGLMLQIVSKTLLDAELTAEVESIGVAMDAMLESFAQRALAPVSFPDWVPTPTNRRMQRGVRAIDSLLYPLIQARLQEGRDHGDLLSKLALARDADGSAFAATEIRNQLVTFFMAGHETSALTLTWALFLLAGHPDIQEQLHAELTRVLGGAPPSAGDIERLPLLERVLDEALRLYPPVWLFARQSGPGATLGGHPIPVGATVFASPWARHRSPLCFPEPDAFRPDRWAGDLRKRLPRFAYMPFGGGPRACIGASYARVAMSVVLASTLQRFALEPTPETDGSPDPTLTLRTKHGMRLRLRSRQKRGAATDPFEDGRALAF